jgi:hypothetical protein
MVTRPRAGKSNDRFVDQTTMPDEAAAIKPRQLHFQIAEEDPSNL